MTNGRRITVTLVGAMLIVFVLSVPGTLRDMYERGGIYLFSQAFLDDIPKRLTGPGRFRFILQPLTAIVLGVLGGIADGKAKRPPYLFGLVFRDDHRRELLRSGFDRVMNLVLMGILTDAIFQWVILGTSHAGAALLVGPILIGMPYVLARALSNRLTR